MAQYIPLPTPSQQMGTVQPSNYLGQSILDELASLNQANNTVALPPVTQHLMPELPTYTPVQSASVMPSTPIVSQATGQAQGGGVLGLLQGFKDSITGGVSKFNSSLGNATKDMSGYDKGLLGIQALSGALSAYNGFQQVKQAKKQLAFQEDVFNRQYGAQAKLTNSSLEDRQKQRVARDPHALGVSEYMAKYGI